MMPIHTINDINLYYEKSGDGQPLVFLHGFTGSTRDWDNQTNLLSKQYQTIAVDHRGHGKTSAPSLEEAYTINLFSEDVYGLLREMGMSPCCLIGHSMGGFMALQFVLDHPEMVKALVLVDTSSGEWDVTPGHAELRAKLDELAQNEGLKAAFEYDATHNPARIERFKKHPEQREIAQKKVMNTSVEGYVYVARSFGKWQPVTKRLSEIKIPTLIFLGEEDTPFFRATQILNDAIPNSQLVRVPCVGHLPHEEAPDFFNEKLEAFLASSV
jgi:2-succinyl-6-hydroxy-2,4-cyclohexadiene-1-carboxylate synthase